MIEHAGTSSSCCISVSLKTLSLLHRWHHGYDNLINGGLTMLPLGEDYICSEDSLAKSSDNRHNNLCSGYSIHGGSVHSRLKCFTTGTLRHGHAHNRIRTCNIRVRLCNQTTSETNRSASASSACAVKDNNWRVHLLMKDCLVDSLTELNDAMLEIRLQCSFE